MRKNIRDKWNNSSVRVKLLIVYVIPVVLILFANIYMYVSINATIEKVNEIYVTNVTLNNLSEQLSLLQNSMREYLENKGTSSLNEYYKAEQGYRDALSGIDSQWYGLAMEAMQENIIRQSDRYLAITQDTVSAKRGRNVEKYKGLYEEAQIICNDIQNCIYSLNSDRFKVNTDNYSVLLSSLRYMEIVTIVILIFISIVNIVLVAVITRSMTTPLADLSVAANKVAEGDFEVDINVFDSEDEIGVVSKAFKKMVSSIQEYIAEIKLSMSRESELKAHELMMESRMKEVQLRSLQAQINPHFLFNTLNAGAQLAMMEGADKTTEFIDNMADFFRYNIKKINNDASIGEEITLVDRYVYILNVRFTGEIHYSKTVESGLSDIRVPSMILQPIVENAVNYGIRDIDWEGHIDLNVYSKDDFVYMSIKDNGIGMSQDKIDSILSGEGVADEPSKHSGSNGIGLGNVIERLQIFTGREDVMEIYSEGEGKGTEFIIKVPVSV